MARVFISYKSEEHKHADKVRQYLEDRDISCWMAPRDIPLGSNYADDIPKALQTCDIFVLLLSKKAQTSPWINREVSMAVGNKLRILPLMLEPCKLTTEYTYYLTNVQFYNLYQGEKRVMQEVVQQIYRVRGLEMQIPETQKAKERKKSPSLFAFWKRKPAESSKVEPIVPAAPKAQAMPRVTAQQPEIPQQTNTIEKVNNQKEHFIFASYAHRDSHVVMPIVRAMRENGLRVWCDNGITAGTEWPAMIEQNLNDSKAVVVFVSQQMLQSMSCRNEIQYAITLNKDILLVYLEDVELSAGLRLQLVTTPAIYYDRYKDEKTFLDTLCNTNMLQSCRE